MSQIVLIDNLHEIFTNIESVQMTRGSQSKLVLEWPLKIDLDSKYPEKDYSLIDKMESIIEQYKPDFAFKKRDDEDKAGRWILESCDLNFKHNTPWLRCEYVDRRSWNLEVSTQLLSFNVKFGLNQQLLAYDTDLVPDPNGLRMDAIGIASDGRIIGAEIKKPVVVLNIEYYEYSGFLDDDKIREMARIVGKINNTPFLGYEAKCLFCEDLNIDRRFGVPAAKVRWKLLYIPPETITLQKLRDMGFGNNVAGGDIIPPYEKPGWKWFWILAVEGENYRFQTPTLATGEMERPIAAYVVDLYENAEFNGVIRIPD